jgi:phage terminase small subunit
MLQRGRPASRLPMPVMPSLCRPDPPDRLTRAEAELWRAIVARMPDGWFPAETLPLLEALVCQSQLLREIEAQVRALTAAGLIDASLNTIKKLDALTRIHDRVARTVTTLATKLRLTPQSRYAADKAHVAVKKAANTSEPWKLRPNGSNHTSA